MSKNFKHVPKLSSTTLQWERIRPETRRSRIQFQGKCKHRNFILTHNCFLFWFLTSVPFGWFARPVVVVATTAKVKEACCPALCTGLHELSGARKPRGELKKKNYIKKNPSTGTIKCLELRCGASPVICDPPTLRREEAANE